MINENSTLYYFHELDINLLMRKLLLFLLANNFKTAFREVFNFFPFVIHFAQSRRKELDTFFLQLFSSSACRADDEAPSTTLKNFFNYFLFCFQRFFSEKQSNVIGSFQVACAMNDKSLSLLDI